MSADLEPHEWLQLLMADWQLIADLAFADLVLWERHEGKFLATAHARPSSAATIFYRDITNQPPRNDWLELINLAFEKAVPVSSRVNGEYESMPTRLAAIPVLIRDSPEPIAVITRHMNLSESRTPTKLQLNYLACAEDLLQMVASGDYPTTEGPTAPKRGAPRANDGLITLDKAGRVVFASPNAFGAFQRVGVNGELEGTLLIEAATKNLPKLTTVDEGLPLVLSGKAAWRADLESPQVTLSVRSVPIIRSGDRVGALVLCRDVTTLRDRERELINKEITIREIHHRVKNNLQTVASLLRIQARQSKSEEVKESLNQAMRRVAAIAVVHDVLSEGVEQSVPFDQIFRRILLLIAELASSYHTIVKTEVNGEFGELPAERATSLALVLTEVVTNAVEHGLSDRSGTVTVDIERTSHQIEVSVVDDGVGLPEGKIGSGLGTQIIKSIVESELRGKINWSSPIRGGTRAVITIPV
jgi:two-component sensor histidine kinase